MANYNEINSYIKNRRFKQFISTVVCSIIIAVSVLLTSLVVIGYSYNPNTQGQDVVTDFAIKYVKKEGVVTSYFDEGHRLTSQDLPEDVASGYDFAGWYYDNNYSIPAQVGHLLKGSITLYAKYHNPVEVTYWQEVEQQLLQSQPFDGSGNAESPFLIENTVQFGLFANLVNTNASVVVNGDTVQYAQAHYKLTADVKLANSADILNGINWTAVGTEASHFKGVFDGDGHTVVHIYGSKGVFGFVDNCQIKNLTVKGAVITANESGVVGGLVSNALGGTQIENCNVFGTINSNYANVGGIVGQATGTSVNVVTITKSNSFVRVNYIGSEEFSNIGGIVGQAVYTTIIGCNNEGVVTSESTVVGGVAGELKNSTASYITNLGSVVSIGGVVGGLVGNVADNATTIYNSSNKGVVDAHGSYVGGAVGKLQGMLVNTTNIVDITVSNNADFVSGLVGMGSATALVENCYALGNIASANTIANFNPVMNLNGGSVVNSGYNMNTIINGSTYLTKENSADIQTLSYEVGSANYNDYSIKNMFDARSTNYDKYHILNRIGNVSAYSQYSNEEKDTVWWSTRYPWDNTIITDGNGSMQLIPNANLNKSLHAVSFYVDNELKAYVLYEQGATINNPSLDGAYNITTWYTDSALTQEYTAWSMPDGNLTLYARSERARHQVSFVLNNIAASNYEETALHSENYTATLAVSGDPTGFEVSVSVTEDGEDKYFTFDGSVVTVYNVRGAIEISARATLRRYFFTISITNLQATGVEEFVYHGSATTFTLTAEDSYDLPNSITVKMGGSIITDVAYDSATGRVTIGKLNGVTGDLVIIASGVVSSSRVQAPTISWDTTTDKLINIAGVTNASSYSMNVYKDDILIGNSTVNNKVTTMNITPSTVSVTYSSWSWNGSYFYSTNKSSSSTGYFSFTIPISGTLSFEYSTSSEANYDKLTVYIANSSKVTASGVTSYTSKSYTVTKGQVFKAQYSKDGSVNKNQDCVYVRNIKIVGGDPNAFESNVSSYIDGVGEYKFKAVAHTTTSGYTDSKESDPLVFGVYNVVNNLTGLTNTGSTVAYSNANYVATLTPDSGRVLDSSSLKVLVGGEEISSDMYTLSSETLTIKKQAITGEITIVAVATAPSLIITIDSGWSDETLLDGVVQPSGTKIGYNEGDVLTFTFSYADSYYAMVYINETEICNDGDVQGITNIIKNQSSGAITGFTVDGITTDITIRAYSCLAAGTYVTLKNGKKKKIEDVTYDDELLVWDFDKGCFAVAKPFWIKKAETTSAVTRCKFSDGSVVEFINGHAVFSVRHGKFINVNDPEFEVGITQTYNEKCEYVTLVSKEVVNKEVTFYNLHTSHHMNNFSNGILTSVSYNNLYEIKNMKFVKDNREIVPYETYKAMGVAKKYYDGLRLGEQNPYMIKAYVSDILENYVPNDIENN